MANLISLLEMSKNSGYTRDTSVYDPTGYTVYGQGSSKLGTVTTALLEPDSGKIRYLVVNDGNKNERLIPVGSARFEETSVYVDNVSTSQFGQMDVYDQSRSYDFDATVPPYNSRDYTSPMTLQLLEERLVVNKTRERVGEVEVSKRVVTHPENVSVTTTHEEVVIERRAVGDGRQVEGNVQLGADSQTIRVDLEAERAQVGKQTYVAEEVEIGKREISETKTYTETVGREELEVERTGDLKVSNDSSMGSSTTDKNKR